MSLLSIREAAELLGVSGKTLRRWEKSGKLVPACRTLGGHRRYDLSTVNRSAGVAEKPKPERKTIVYARVSSQDQKAQLETQAKRLEQYCQDQGWNTVETVKDLGRGMNCKKKGLLRVLSE